MAGTYNELLTGKEQESMEDNQALPKMTVVEPEESIRQDRLGFRTSHQLETTYSTYRAQE